ncbi:MAG: hypothetical protein LBH09_08015 [Peptococcaceae bacterium]|jgi:hypothetical protein|nr:hypothetical protein [Peptococcaceae bacterium]
MRAVVLFDEKLRIFIPGDFSQAEEYEAAELFPSLERPQVILASDGFSRFLTFSLLNKPLSSEETLNAAREMRKLIWSLYPNSLLSEAAVIRFGDLRCSGFSFRTGAKEAQIFNTMFTASFEDRLLLGTFGCGIDDEDGKILLIQTIAEAEHMGVRE